MEANKQTIPEIFNIHRILEIPFFQRSYVWDTKNWDRFLEDMKAVSQEANKKYFFGSLILKEKGTSSNEPTGGVRTIIDGQQRLTTLAIFFNCLYEAHGNIDMFYKLVKFRGEKSERPVINHNHYDKEPFEAVLNNLPMEQISDEKQEGQIIKCYEYFKSNEDVLKKEIDPEKIFHNIYFVVIDLSPNDDEQEIFDTINSLGVSLTTAELLKNYLFDRGEEQLFNDTWKNKFETEDREYWSTPITQGGRENIDLLMQSFLTIESKADPKYLGTSSIFNNYKIFFEGNKNTFDKKKFITNLIGESERYRQNIDSSFTNQVVSSSIERMNLIIFGLNNTTVVPYLLYIIRNVEGEEQSKMIFLLENYFIRRLVCKEPTKNYNNLFSSYIRKEVKTYDDLLSNLLNDAEFGKFPDNEDFADGIKYNNLINKYAKVFLYLLEISIRGADEQTDLKGLDQYTLEHVMPKKWWDKWQGTNILDADETDKKILTLGNLTILTSGLNKSISNNSWKVKKEGSGKKPGLNEYASGIKIFKDCLILDKWNEGSISKRASFLADEALNVWPDPRAS